MAEWARSVPDVAEQLMHEFQDRVSSSEVTAIVIRLSQKGTVTLAALAEMARAELASLGAATLDHEPREAIVPANGGC